MARFPVSFWQVCPVLQQRGIVTYSQSSWIHLFSQIHQSFTPHPRKHVPALLIDAWPTFPSFPLAVVDVSTPQDQVLLECRSSALPKAAPRVAAELLLASHMLAAIPTNSGRKTAFMVKMFNLLHLHLPCFNTEICFTCLPCWTAMRFAPRCDQSWHLPFHKEVVQTWRVGNFLLPRQNLTTSKLSALCPSAVWPHDSQLWQARQLCTSLSPLTHIWQKELISQVHKENQLKNPSDCFALVCRYLVAINITVSRAHVSKRNTAPRLIS